MKLIKQFERESGLEIYGLGLDRVKWKSTLEAYTLLIVRECANVAMEEDHDPSECILKHFGVEE